MYRLSQPPAFVHHMKSKKLFFDSFTEVVGLLVLQDFYEDLFEELSKYGELESLNVCDNLADHMVFENLFPIAKVLNCSARWHFFIVKDSMSNALDPEYV
jgi:hypothetical protein